jgi:hypothetical protein
MRQQPRHSPFHLVTVIRRKWGIFVNNQHVTQLAWRLHKDCHQQALNLKQHPVGGYMNTLHSEIPQIRYDIAAAVLIAGMVMGLAVRFFA